MDWSRLIVACAVIAGAVVLAKLVDMRMASELAPGAVTWVPALRRSIMGVIIFVGVLTALLLIPGAPSPAGCPPPRRFSGSSSASPLSGHFRTSWQE